MENSKENAIEYIRCEQGSSEGVEVERMCTFVVQAFCTIACAGFHVFISRLPLTLQAEPTISTSPPYYLTRPRGPCQVKQCKLILEQSLLTGCLASWLSELSTSFPISLSQSMKNLGTRTRLEVFLAVKYSLWFSLELR